MKLPKIRLPSPRKAESTVSELAILAGFLMVMYGLHQVYPPLMWVIGGLWLMFPARKE